MLGRRSGSGPACCAQLWRRLWMTVRDRPTMPGWGPPRRTRGQPDQPTGEALILMLTGRCPPAPSRGRANATRARPRTGRGYTLDVLAARSEPVGDLDDRTLRDEPQPQSPRAPNSPILSPWAAGGPGSEARPFLPATTCGD